MEQADRDSIQRNIRTLSQMVNLETLNMELMQSGIIDNLFLQRIKSKYVVPQEQAQEFFLSYTKRGPHAFGILLEVLEKSGHVSEARALRSRQQVVYNTSSCAVTSTTGEGENPLRGESLTNGHYAFAQSSSNSNSPTSSTSVPSSPLMRPHPQSSRVEPLSESNSPTSSSSSLSATDQARSELGRCTMENQPPLIVDVRKAVEYNMGDFDAYPMWSKPRGFALIINNIDFLGDFEAKRDGADKDSNYLEALLKQLGFEVMIRHNVKKMELLSENGIIKKFLEQFTQKEVNACLVAIMSHGQEGRIRTHDAEDSRNPTLNYWHFYRDILKEFNNRYCPTLKGKPKIFIIQACQGDTRDRGVRRTRTDGRDLTGPVDEISSSLEDYAPPDNIPENEDMIICYSTTPGFVSNRDIEHGTWYIHSLCKVFMEHAWNTELTRLLRKVGNHMRQLTSERGDKQMCSFHDIGLHKSVYFNPGIHIEHSP